MRNAQVSTQDERLWAALAWLPVTPFWPILALYSLFADSKKQSLYIRYHAMHSITAGVVLIPVSILTVGLGSLLYLVFFFWAVQAYQGKKVRVPFISRLLQDSGFVA
ncbi:MAG: DUF4870 domain-containing protein [Chloroflexi bacterium]|jgi:uncharacterized membrane protein|nr:DUF4870 domain-containing protein [Chloroflexota bacterium]